MKFIFLTLISSLVFAIAFSQEKKYTDSAVADYIEKCKCIYKPDQTIVDFKSLNRIGIYKFVQNIVLISFKSTTEETLQSYINAEGGIKDDMVLEKYTLSSNERDSLISIIFNYEYVGHPLKIFIFECKKPQNAILYLDKNNKVITATNICFSGTGFSSWNSKKYKNYHTSFLGPTCFGKYELLANFFKSVGIKNIL